LELINATSLISFLIARQNLDTSDLLNYGGFGYAPSISCSITETYFAILTIQILNATDKINATAALHYTEKLQLSIGAFTVAGGITQPTLAYSYSGLMICTSLSSNGNDGSNFIWLIISIIIAGVSSFLTLKYVKNRRSKKVRFQKFKNRGKT
jgi:hypothetical protein